jgi:hypothetical protein
LAGQQWLRLAAMLVPVSVRRMSDPLKALQQEIRAVPPASIAALDPGQLEVLGAAVANARARQADALQAAIDDGLGFLPRLMRGAVKRALLG